MKQEKIPNFVDAQEFIAFINRKRVFALIRVVFYIIFASISGAGGFALIITGAILGSDSNLMPIFLPVGFILFIPGISLFVSLIFHDISSFKRLFLDAWANRAVEGKYQEFHYAYRVKNLAPFVMEIRKFTKKNFDPLNASFCNGKAFGYGFSSFGYETQGSPNKYRSALSVDEKRKGSAKRQYGIVDLGGRFILIDHPNIDFKLSIVDRRASLRLKKDLCPNELRSESVEFDSTYKVSYEGTSLEKIYEVLTPSLIAGILHLKALYNGQISLFFNEKKVQVYFDHYNSGFRLSLVRKINEKTLEQFRFEMLIPYYFLRIIYNVDN